MCSSIKCCNTPPQRCVVVFSVVIPHPQRCAASPIDELVVTDTIDQQENQELYPKLHTVDVSHLFAEAIRRVHNNEPLLALFKL